MKKYLIIIASFFLITSPVLAQVATVTPGANKEAAQATRMATAKSKADSEIARRIASLTTLSNRIQSLKRLSSDDKTKFTNSIQAQNTALSNLKSKIDADTDVATLRADIKSLYTEYRIYMLYLPQLRILSSTDVMGDAADSLIQLATKLQGRINTSKAAGHDVSALQTSLDDMSAKIADAKTQYAAAEAAVTNLVPDAGDQTKMTSNNAALQAARTDLKTGATDLKTARTDAQSIITGLKSL